MKFVFINFIHLIKRFTSSTILNVLGMSAAFSVFIIIAIQLNYNYTYNRSFENADNIYTFRRHYPSDDINVWTISVPVAEKMSVDFSEIKKYCLLHRGQGRRSFDIHDGENTLSVGDAELIVGTAGFKEIFRPEIVRGNASDVFEQNDKAMISEKTAQSMFGDQEPIGKVIYEHYSQTPYSIVAVYKDFPDNSSIGNGVYAKLTSYQDNNWSYDGYFEIIPGSYDSLTEKLNGAGFRGEETLKQQDIDPSTKEDYVLTPLSDIYMMKRPGVRTVSLSILAIAIFILMIAYTNFINFSIAIAPVRIKNFNIRRILGSNKLSLTLVIISEGVIITLIAFVPAVLFIYFFNTTSLADLFVADLSLSVNISLILIIAIVFIVLSIPVSIYPAHYLTSVKENIILNGSFAFSSRGSRLRNILITFQYITAIVLISVSVFIKLQQEYMKDYHVGFEKENIVYFPIEGLKTDVKTFAEEITSNPLITDYTTSGFIPGRIRMSWGRNFEGKNIQNLYAWPVSYNFLDFFNINLIAGQNFTKRDTTGPEQMILNKKFLEKYEFDENIIGKNFPMFNEGTIMGIAEDVNFESLHSSIEPMAFVIVNDQNTWINHIFFKVSGENIPQAIAYMEDTWKKFSDDDFNLTFLDSAINELYKQEENQSKLIGVFALITVIIAMMGVYGLIAFNIRYKEKEIGIRKVNGATEPQIVFMLNRSMLLLFLTAFIIAIPIAYYLVMKWLENFAYKVSVSWWVFAGAGLIVLLISFVTVSWQSWKAAIANPVDSLKIE